MRTALIRNLGVTAACAVFGTLAHADCGKPRLLRVVPATIAASRGVALSTGREAEVNLPQSAGDGARGSVVGLWLTTAVIEGQQTQAFEAFTSDGLEVLNDNGSPIEGNVCLGVWQTGARGVISVNHPSWYYDPAGNLIGTATIKEQITVESSGQTFHGTITVDIYDLNNNLLVHLAGSYAAKRISV